MKVRSLSEELLWLLPAPKTETSAAGTVSGRTFLLAPKTMDQPRMRSYELRYDTPTVLRRCALWPHVSNAFSTPIENPACG